MILEDTTCGLLFALYPVILQNKTLYSGVQCPVYAGVCFIEVLSETLQFFFTIRSPIVIGNNEPFITKELQFVQEMGK